MKFSFTLLLLLSLLAFGCGPAAQPVQSANPVAASDPDARARELLAEFKESEDGATWVRNNAFALTVFDKVTDPALKAEYDSSIAPLLGR